FDVLKQQLENPRLVDGSPIPITELHKLALEANLLPSIFDTKTQDMWLGRRVRTATEAQRIALIARDQCCIGCGANPLWCQAHHIIWWSNNGPTDLENLVLVCNDCHHKIHDDGWQVCKHPKTGKCYLKPPTQPPTRPTDESAKNLSGETPTHSSGEPPTHPSEEHPTRPTDESAKNLSGETPTHSSGEPPTHPSNERSVVPSSEPSTRPPRDSPADTVNERSVVRSVEPSTRPSNECPTVSVDKPASTSSGEPSTRGSGEFPAVSVGEPLNGPPGEPSTHPPRD
ncbi:MAG: HNH endonuclease, partial [Acidimicrobiia bacterium]|nr:HNH endonuclease [Acidimicrobiia bacterium]